MAFPPSESLGQPCIFLISLWFPWIPTWNLPKGFRFPIGFSTFNSGQRRNETFLFQKCFILSEMFRYFRIVSFSNSFVNFNIGLRRNKTFFFQISFILSKVQRFSSSRPGARLKYDIFKSTGLGERHRPRREQAPPWFLIWFGFSLKRTTKAIRTTKSFSGEFQVLPRTPM